MNILGNLMFNIYIELILFLSVLLGRQSKLGSINFIAERTRLPTDEHVFVIFDFSVTKKNLARFRITIITFKRLLLMTFPCMILQFPFIQLLKFLYVFIKMIYLYLKSLLVTPLHIVHSIKHFEIT